MTDEMEDMLWFGGFALAIIGIIVLMAVATAQSIHEEQRLIRQCMEDGRKEYECVGMIRSRENPVIIPVPTQAPMITR